MTLASFRDDYAFPFRVSASGSATQASYAAHVGQMIRQVLLTAPGERVDLPEFGCGLRRLLFAPSRSGGAAPPGLFGTSPGDAATASAQILVQQALERWLGDQIKVQQVIVLGGEDAPEGELEIEVRYLLIEVQDVLSTRVRLLS
jgi:hypothetical protein